MLGLEPFWILDNDAPIGSFEMKPNPYYAVEPTQEPVEDEDGEA